MCEWALTVVTRKDPCLGYGPTFEVRRPMSLGSLSRGETMKNKENPLDIEKSLGFLNSQLPTSSIWERSTPQSGYLLRHEKPLCDALPISFNLDPPRFAGSGLQQLQETCKGCSVFCSMLASGVQQKNDNCPLVRTKLRYSNSSDEITIHESFGWGGLLFTFAQNCHLKFRKYKKQTELPNKISNLPKHLQVTGSRDGKHGAEKPMRSPSYEMTIFGGEHVGIWCAAIQQQTFL